MFHGGELCSSGAESLGEPCDKSVLCCVLALEMRELGLGSSDVDHKGVVSCNCGVVSGNHKLDAGGHGRVFGLVSGGSVAACGGCSSGGCGC